VLLDQVQLLATVALVGLLFLIFQFQLGQQALLELLERLELQVLLGRQALKVQQAASLLALSPH
jgi:hypothetical protein